jgi:hypothetical protein
MILHHSFAASRLAERCREALAEAGHKVDLDMDPGMDVLGGPGLRLSSYLREDLEGANKIIRRILVQR